MEYFTAIEQNLEAAHKVLSTKLRQELEAEITKISKQHLKNRSIRFDDSMGSITIDIQLRGDGGELIINENGSYVSGKGSWLSSSFNKRPVVQKLSKVLRCYEELTPSLYVSERFTVEV